MRRGILFFLAVTALLPSQTYSLRTLVAASDEDNGPLYGPHGVAIDPEGNVYVAEASAGVIRRIAPDGSITRIAVSGRPTVMTMDRDGRLVFNDQEACTIRKMDSEGAIADVAGIGRCAASMGGGARDRPASDTELGVVSGMTTDPEGRLVFSEESSHSVKRVDHDGYVRTIAGLGIGGFGGDDEAAPVALLRSPAGLAYDRDGNLYIADGANCRIRRVNSDGNILTVAGTGTCAGRTTNFGGGFATRTSLGRLAGLAYDAESHSLLIASAGQARVLRFSLTELRIAPLMGNGTLGSASSEDPLEMALNEPTGIAVSAETGVVVSVASGFQLYGLRDGVTRTLAGRWPAADLLQPRGLCLEPNGSMLIVDGAAERLLRWREEDGLTVVAGAPYPSGFSIGDGGPAVEATITVPVRVACGPNGEIYLVHGSQLRRIDADGVIHTLRSGLSGPAGIAVEPDGRIYLSESTGHRVIRYDPWDGAVTTVAGTGKAGLSGDGGAAAEAQLSEPGDLAFDREGNLLIAERGNRRVRLVTPGGSIRTVAGSRREFSYADITGLRATDVGLAAVEGLATDPTGNVYIGEASRLSRVDADGVIHVMAGYLGEDDDGVQSYLHQPLGGVDGVTVDAAGRVIFSVRSDRAVLVAEPE